MMDTFYFYFFRKTRLDMVIIVSYSRKDLMQRSCVFNVTTGFACVALQGYPPDNRQKTDDNMVASQAKSKSIALLSVKIISWT